MKWEQVPASGWHWWLVRKCLWGETGASFQNAFYLMWLYKRPSTQLCLQVNFHIFTLLKYFLPSPLSNSLQRLKAYRNQAGDLRSWTGQVGGSRECWRLQQRRHHLPYLKSSVHSAVTWIPFRPSVVRGSKSSGEDRNLRFFFCKTF